ncbi:MAG TPA: tetratricopeptide repeat protein, partial [Thermosynechococcaceae cyanobacterium]
SKLSTFQGIEFLEQQLQSNPSRQTIILQPLDDHALVLRNYRKSSAAYTRYLAASDKADPDRAAAWGNLALAYSKIGDFQPAIEFQQQAIALKRAQKSGELNSYISILGEFYNAQGANEKAGETFGQLAQSAADRNDVFWAIEGTKGMTTSYAGRC